MDPASKKQRWALQLGLHHQDPQVFSVFSWQSNRCRISGYYLIYRFMAVALFLSISVFGVSVSKHPNYWIIYLSHIGLILQTLHLIIAAAIPVLLLLNPLKDSVDDSLPVLFRFSWFLYNVTNSVSLCISIIFWTGISVLERDPKDTDFPVHGMNSIISICDVFISKRPCRILHFTHALAVFIPYGLFSIIYWAAGGQREDGTSAIYPILDWDNLSVTVPCVTAGLIFSLLLIHGLIWALHLLRDRLIACVNSDTIEEQPTLQGQWNPTLIIDDTHVSGLEIQA